ncbi:unnamed protein product [Arctogadus glacialis]
MRKKGPHPRVVLPKRDSSPIKPSANRETLTYAQAQRIVELEVDGRPHRLSIFDKLEVVGDDTATAQEIMECNSNKENREKPPQVLVRSARLKNSQQRKSGAAAAQGPGGPPSSALLEPRFRTVEYNLPVVPRRPAAFYQYTEQTEEELDEEVEYDMDEEDYAWLELLNERRRSEGVSQVSYNLFEFLMDRLEKESLGEQRSPVDEDAVCCICMDGDAADSNVILFCDACDIAVHQECYGVPYVPEGQWLCRHCLQRPTRPAECLFCPNRGGALKKTDDDRWGHVACALWVPEVGFSDTVFIEPIDGVGNIPPARWKLTCSLCKEKGAGACIQCHRANCYTAFHVSCAQRAGLYMKMEPVREPSEAGAAAFSVKKTAYCCAHTPEGCDRRPLHVYDQPGDRKPGKQRSKTKIKREEPDPEAPTISGPSITLSSFESIVNQVAVQKKRSFVERVLSYWVLKRQSRNNVPLIRRLQANSQPPKNHQPVSPKTDPMVSPPKTHPTVSPNPQTPKNPQPVSPKTHPTVSTETHQPVSPTPQPPRTHLPVSPKTSPTEFRLERSQELKEQLTEWHRLRHDLERARLLLELIRKREKLKREEVKLQQSLMEVQLTPLNILMRAVLAQLQDKDTYNIFAQPVSLKEVPDYLDHISQPMDFSTVRKRIEAHHYSSLEALEEDFNLIISNCMTYNNPESFFYKAAQRMQDHGGAILRKARRQAHKVGYQVPGGTHLPTAPPPAEPAPFSWEHVDRVLSPAYRLQTPLQQQLDELLEQLDACVSMKQSPSRSKRLKLLKKSIVEVRAQLNRPLHTRTPAPGPLEPTETPPAEAQGSPARTHNHEERSIPPPPAQPLCSLAEEPPGSPHPSSPDASAPPLVTDTTTSEPQGPPAAAPTPTAAASPPPTGPTGPPTGPCRPPAGRRGSLLFRKSKSVSPLKASPAGGVSPGGIPPGCVPPLGTKSFLSVVIPRLETLLLPRKRARSASTDRGRDGDCPRKRLDTGLANGFVVEEEEEEGEDEGSGSSRLLEPRRRCASESSISSSGSLLCSTSTVTVQKSLKGRSLVARRCTADVKTSRLTCREHTQLPRDVHLATDHGAPNGDAGVASQRGADGPPGRAVTRRADAIPLRREALPRSLLRQQAQLAMAS